MAETWNSRESIWSKRLKHSSQTDPARNSCFRISKSLKMTWTCDTEVRSDVKLHLFFLPEAFCSSKNCSNLQTVQKVTDIFTDCIDAVRSVNFAVTLSHDFKLLHLRQHGRTLAIIKKFLADIRNSWNLCKCHKSTIK